MLKKLRPVKVYRELNKINHTVIFPDEGNVKVRLPRVSLLNAFLPHNKKLIKNCLSFIQRPTKEILLRKLIFELYQNSILDKNKSVIDIGAWISDNTIVWSKLLSDHAQVFAIDPSEDNIKFGKQLAELNDCKNISWHKAVCSDEVGQSLFFNGNIGHTQFNENQIQKYKPSPLKTTTLDAIAGDQNLDQIGMIHVDVEGFEKKVLLGAKQIISKSLPVVLFEQHITSENPFEIHAFLEPFGYRTYMINEVLPGCNLDCRNFISIPKTMDISSIQNSQFVKDTRHLVWSATLGNPLIEL